MNWELVFILAMPAAVATFIIWMIAAGYTKTGALPADTKPNPYPERIDAFGRWFVGIASAISYLIIAGTLGFRAAAIAFAFLLLIDAGGALIWTAGQLLLARQSAMVVPFGTRLFRNFRDFYPYLVIGILAAA